MRIQGALSDLSEQIVPGTLTFVGDLAVHGGSPARIGLQRCGSPVTHPQVAGGFAVNGRVVVWCGDGVLEGRRATRDAPFPIHYPTALNPLQVELDDTTLYLEPADGIWWSARLPQALRSG